MAPRSPTCPVPVLPSAVGLNPRIAMTASDADLIKTYVRAGLGIGVLAEMAILPSDTDLHVLPADELFAQCTTWIVLRQDTVLRDYVLEFIGQFAPHLDRRDVKQALSGDGQPIEWPAAPHWREWLAIAHDGPFGCGRRWAAPPATAHTLSQKRQPRLCGERQPLGEPTVRMTPLSAIFHPAGCDTPNDSPPSMHGPCLGA
ncbi:MAG: hypothetical protein WDW36_008835 [Sanguina aurantia]